MIKHLSVFIFAFFFALPVQARDLSDFGAWPVLHDGRVKTMESFARSNFYRISGATEAEDLAALEWLAEALFDPSASIARHVIKVDHVPLLKLPAGDSKLYTLNEVMEAMRPHQDLLVSLDQRDPAMLSAPQKSLLDVYNALVIYNQVIQSFSAVLPINGGEKTYMEGAGLEEQRALIEAGGFDNRLVRFIPHDDPHTVKVSLWEALLLEKETDIPTYLSDMAHAWKNGDDQQWESVAITVKDRLQQDVEQSFALKLEHAYVTVNPILWAIIFYVLGCVCFVLPKGKNLSLVGLALISGGAMAHFLGLTVRSFILQRPPTGTIYETFLLSSFIVVLFGLLIFWKKRTSLFLIGSVVCALVILFVSRFFVEGDSLNVLVAVLNTNFWLATHVTCIIIGYAVCVVAALSGHLYLLTNRRDLKTIMIPLALVALLFTAIGTLLGGIWADQSWGRFWGWDPKENGALLIVLWLAWILHGRISGHFSMRGFAAVLGLTNMAVAVTWFGVNLLGVGLHSYGFISGIAIGLGIFCTLQAAIIMALYVRHKRVYA